MNVKVIGSIVRWAAVLTGAIGAFMGDTSFMDAVGKLKDNISSGDWSTIIASAVTVATLGWSIWDKIKTQNKEIKANAKIKLLSEQVQTTAAAKK